MTQKQETIGQGIRLARVEHGLTQEELANAVGCSRITVIQIEHEASNPGYMLAYLFARVLKISLDAFSPNTPPNTCLCHLYGPAECRVCFPNGYAKA